MNVVISGVRDAGDSGAERLVLKVLQADDIGRYAVFDTEASSDGQPTTRLRGAYWFPDKKVKPGDLVVLYTKPGEPSEKVSASGATSHFFYWGLDRPTWDSGNDCAVLLRIEDWSASAPVQDTGQRRK